MQPPPSCPVCHYNLTGLPTCRCPECGRAFDWDDVRAAEIPPTIAFERERGSGKILGFVKTWLCVMFAPWIFARQVTRRYSLAHGLIFGAICFAGALPYLYVNQFYIDSAVFVPTWLLTAATYVVLQAAVVALMDPQKEPIRHRFRFWLTVGGYTSAVMLTESATGPPFVTIWVLLEILQDPASFQFPDSAIGYVTFAQYALWLASFACCYFERRRRALTTSTRATVQTIVLSVVLVFLYATAFQIVGANVYDLIESF